MESQTQTGEHPRDHALLYVPSRITSPILSEETYNNFYDNQHIPDVFSTGHFTSALRYRATLGSQEWSHLALYPTRSPADIDWLLGPGFVEFAKESAKYAVLPGIGNVYDVAAFGPRAYRFMQACGSAGLMAARQSRDVDAAKVEPGLVVAMEIHDDSSSASNKDLAKDFADYLHKEAAATVDGYAGCVLYELIQSLSGEEGIAKHLVLAEVANEESSSTVKAFEDIVKSWNSGRAGSEIAVTVRAWQGLGVWYA